jgi:hypothetical protein
MLPAPALPDAATQAAMDPAALATQKEEYERLLEQQLQEGAEQLAATMKAQIEALHAEVAQEKTLHSLLVDQQVKQQELVLSQQYNQQLMMLTQATQRKGAELEQEATHLMLNYHQRKVEEDFVASQEAVENQFADMQRKFADELAKATVFPLPPMGAPQLPSLVPAPLGPLPPPLAFKASAPVPPGMLAPPPPGRAPSFGRGMPMPAPAMMQQMRPAPMLMPPGAMNGSFMVPAAVR